ncbi:MAG: glycosyl transferase [Pseudomonadota bacterium]|nr:glycosyl transferase [Pseudomonadota bacterium]
MPSYCGEQWIDAALSSIAAEGTEGIDVLLIDSSPTSATRDIAQAYVDRLSLRVLERCDLASWQEKTNIGVAIAESTHLCWLGVDDLWLPGRAAAVRRWIKSAPEAALHLAPAAIVDKNGLTLGVWRCPLPCSGEQPPALVMQRLLVQNFIAAPAPVFRKDAWLGCGGLDERLWYTADWDLWLKLITCGPVYCHDSLSVGFRIHDGALGVTGSRDAADFASQMQIVLDRHLPKLRIDSRGIERAARASIAVNTALASAYAGDGSRLLRAAAQVLRLGPAGVWRYVRDSRIVDRVLPRVRAKLAGAFRN